MPTFSFSSQSGTSLSDRIAMINARQKAKIAAIQDDDAAEAELMKQVNEENELAAPTMSKEPTTPGRVVDMSSEMMTLNDLAQKVDSLAAEIKKMNKHVNSIVKMLKKD